MKHRSPLAVIVLSLITFGIYGVYWQVSTKSEMNRLGANIPTAWLLIIPLVNWYWLWKYSEGVEKVTGGKTSGVLAFILLFLLGMIGAAILQNEFNNLGPVASDAPAGGSTFSPDTTFNPTAPVAAAPAPVVPASDGTSDQNQPPVPPTSSAPPLVQ